MIAVESGLQLNERVVTSGTNMIKNGDRYGSCRDTAAAEAEVTEGMECTA